MVNPFTDAIGLLFFTLTAGAVVILLWRELRVRRRVSAWKSIGILFLACAFLVIVSFGGGWLLWRQPENFVLGIFLLLPVAAIAVLFGFARWHRTRPSPGTYARLIAGNLLLFGCLLSFLPPAFEIYYRFYCNETDSLAVTKLSRRWVQRYFHNNSAGFPDSAEYVDVPGKSPRRIVLLGDSFAAGYGIKNEKDRLAALLRAARPESMVHLLARPGADTRLHLQFLRHYFAKGHQANDVVLIYGLNDIQDLLAQRGGSFQSAITPPQVDWPWLRENSYFFDSLYHKALVARNSSLKMQNYSQFMFAGYEGEVWKKQQEQLSTLRELAESQGASFRVVTFPLVHAVGPNYEFRAIHEKLDQFWKSLKVPHMDLVRVFDGIPPAKLVVNRFDAHPNAFAHHLAARNIAEFLGAE